MTDFSEFLVPGGRAGRAQAEARGERSQGTKFWKVFFMANLYRKYTRTLTFQIFFQGTISACHCPEAYPWDSCHLSGEFFFFQHTHTHTYTYARAHTHTHTHTHTNCVLTGKLLFSSLLMCSLPLPPNRRVSNLPLINVFSFLAT